MWRLIGWPLPILEIQAADLLRRREEVAEAIAQDVIDLVLAYETADRRLETLTGQMETQLQRQAVLEARYRTGQGTTDQMLRMWQRTDDLKARRAEAEIQQGQTMRELEVLCHVAETGNRTVVSRRRVAAGAAASVAVADF